MGDPKYTSITPKTNFKIFNTFADADENPELPGSDWDLNFIGQDGTTKVHISIYNESLERLERMVAMGFKEGTAATLENLKELLQPGGTAVPPNYLDRLADAVVSLEYYMETLQAGRADPWYMLDNAQTCLEALA